jgi:hypothetical protein
MMTSRQAELGGQYDILERFQDTRVFRSSSLAISVPKVLSLDDTKAVICKVWEAEIARTDPDFSAIAIYYDLSREQYVPGLGTFDPPSPTEQTRSAHKLATYLWSNRVTPPARNLTMIKNVDGTIIDPPKVVELDPAKDCSPRRQGL